MKGFVMKKSLILIFLIFVISSLISSCATVSGIETITDGVAINNSNFIYVGTIEKTAKSVYFLGIGGGNPEFKAFEALKGYANLKAGDVLTNYKVFTQTSYGLLGIIVEKQVTVTVDIIHFN